LAGRLPLLAIGPTANWGAKQWPAERFAEAARRLTAPDGLLPGAAVAVFGGPGEREAAQPLLEALPEGQVIDLIGEPDLLDAFALLRQCSLYLGNDSGLMHMAAAAGIPTLGLFGPSPDWRYGPWGPLSAAVRTPQSFEELVSENPAFDHRRQDSLMLGLTVDAVVEAATALWQRVGTEDELSAGSGAFP
jgi:ADP-heptose:LPS heptosyltransferase